MDYRFELAGKPHLSNGDDIVQVRLVHVPDAKPVPDAVVFESAADMGLSGMPTMPGPVVALPPKNGLYLFKIYPGMAGKWALHLAAKAQGQCRATIWVKAASIRMHVVIALARV